MTVIPSFSKRPLKMDPASIKRRNDYKNLPHDQKEKIRSKRRQAYKDNPERFRRYVEQWHVKHPTYCRDFMREHHKTHKEHTRNENRTQEMWIAHNHVSKEPLAKYCELCPPEDVREAQERHHPDYDYPDMFLSLCKSCHTYLHHWLKKHPEAVCVL